MSKSKRLVFFGNERLATGLPKTDCSTLKALIAADYEIVAVVSNFTAGRGRQARKLEIAEVAEDHKIPLLLPENPVEIADQLRGFRADAAVLVAYGRIVPQSIIDIFPGGIINLHPSLLPFYRGPTPVEAAILEGAAETGVSLMRLAAKMDAGPVFVQKAYKLSGHETKTELAANLLKLGSQLLIENLPAILDGYLTPKPQTDADATYTKLIKKTDGELDFGRPAEELERQVRAYAGWPRSTAEISGRKVIITGARIAKNESDGDLVIKCTPGFLAIEELIAPSGKKMSGAEFIRGYKNN